ncbi:MAG: methionyl-tRNA formyltransferase [Alphaproteobacteria bacterium]
MRIIFMGTPEFAVPSLAMLMEDPAHEVVAVWTQPPRPAGRGHKVVKSPVHKLAEQADIPVYHPTRFKEEGAIEAFEAVAAEADIAVVAAYGLILPTRVLNAPRLGSVNVHASLLPRWRGASPIQSAILAGDEVTGVTIMRMVYKLDAGDMLSSAAVDITSTTTAPELHDHLALAGASLLPETLAGLETGAIQPMVQDEAEVTYAPKLTREDGHLDLTREGAEALDRRIRALTPWPGCALSLPNGKPLKVHEARYMPDINCEGIAPGTLIDRYGSVATCDGALRLLTVQPANRKAMQMQDWMNGVQIRAGQLLIQTETA